MKIRDFQPSSQGETATTKRLLLITATYPYGPGESFLVAELEHLAPHFGAIELVPSYCVGEQKRYVDCATVNLDYAHSRWGKGRKLNVFKSAIIGVLRYKWRKDLMYIATHPHKFENLKELLRALYRAHMFESFLKERIARQPMSPDMVYFYWMVPEVMGAISLCAAGAKKFKVVARAHGSDLYEFTRPGKYFGLRESIAHSVDAVYCISDHGRAYLRDRDASLSGKCHIAKLGVSYPGFKNRQPGTDILSIVSCSFVSAVKRIDLLIDALGWLLDEKPGVKVQWTHIGNGVLFDRMRQYAAEKLQGRAHVVFTGYLSGDQILQLYRTQCFDVFINVSSSEGLPVSLMEAASVGMPLVATDVGGSSEIVGQRNGILLAPDPDAEAIARALLRFADKEWAAGLRENSYLCWRENFDANKNHDTFAQALLKMID